MQKDHRIRLGPLTKTMICGATWSDIWFPPSQTWADEVEKVFCFLESQGQFKRFLKNLCAAKPGQRDSALAEARIAFFFHRNGFKIISWEPVGDSSKKGEYEIQWNSLSPIFVEVKGPRWEGELSDEEKNGPRRKQPRYIDGEARSVNPVEKIVYYFEAAYPKFDHDRPNLLVLDCSLLFVSPREMPHYVIEPQIKEALSEYNKIGGILLFDFDYKSGIYNNTLFIENERALNSCKIPDDIVKGLSATNNSFFTKRIHTVDPL